MGLSDLNADSPHPATSFAALLTLDAITEGPEKGGYAIHKHGYLEPTSITAIAEAVKIMTGDAG